MDPKVEMELILSNTQLMLEYLSIKTLPELKIFDKKFVKNPSNKTNDVIDSMVDSLLMQKKDYYNRLYVVNLLADELSIAEGKVKHRACLFGSSVNNVGFLDADVDVYIEVEGLQIKPNERESILKKIQRALFQSMFKQYFNFRVIRSRYCPIIKMWPLDKYSLFTVDINVGHSMAVFNSQFLGHLFSQHPTLQKLAVILRLFGKRTNIIDHSGFTSFSFTILLLFFLQHFPEKDCSIISPNFEHVRQKAKEYENLVGDKNASQDAAECVRNLVNIEELGKHSVCKLLYSFFKFVFEFNFTHNFVYPLDATKPMLRHQYTNMKLEVKAHPLNSLITIIDPFEPDKNITRQMQQGVWNHLMMISRQICTQKEDYFENLENLHKLMTFKEGKRFGHYVFKPCHCFIVKSAKKLKTAAGMDLIVHLLKDFRKLLVEDGLVKSIKDGFEDVKIIMEKWNYIDVKGSTLPNTCAPSPFKLATLSIKLDDNAFPNKRFRKRQRQKKKLKPTPDKDTEDKDAAKKEDTEIEPNFQDVHIDLFGFFHSRHFFECYFDVKHVLPKGPPIRHPPLTQMIERIAKYSIRCNDKCEKA